MFILLRCGKITQKLWSCDIFLIPKYNCDGFCNTLVDRVFGNQNYSPVQACAFVPGLKIWMEFFFLLVLYYSWCNYICILVATTWSFLFLSVLHYSCCNCTHTCFPVLSEERLLWYPPIETLKCFNKKNSWPYLYISVQTIVLNVTITKIIS